MHCKGLLGVWVCGLLLVSDTGNCSQPGLHAAEELVPLGLHCLQLLLPLISLLLP